MTRSSPAPGPGAAESRRRGPVPAGPTRTPRATTLLDAAISVIADDGLRGLTHRSVDARADLPAGSASYYFRSRSALLQGVLGRLLELDAADYATLGASAPPPSADPRALIRTWTKLFAHWLGPGRERLRARYTLYLEGRHHPELQQMLDAASAQVIAGAHDLLRAAGSPSPQRDARLLVAFLDGLLYDQLIRPHPPVSTAELRRRIGVVVNAVWPG
ncbi:TetR/AcrR family transcriptional regulator [Actinopolymorpha alba]|uniref:TetR/AcrR family transcriptional regulator n=1 Tax=Actinopolymorpha alba TaxID=533267 RepID=UPI00037EB4EB|nr:TetR family transcriptional regulator [Actinopolymorpha alba]